MTLTSSWHTVRFQCVPMLRWRFWWKPLVADVTPLEHYAPTRGADVLLLPGFPPQFSWAASRTRSWRSLECRLLLVARFRWPAVARTRSRILPQLCDGWRLTRCQRPGAAWMLESKCRFVAGWNLHWLCACRQDPNSQSTAFSAPAWLLLLGPTTHHRPVKHSLFASRFSLVLMPSIVGTHWSVPLFPLQASCLCTYP